MLQMSQAQSVSRASVKQPKLSKLSPGSKDESDLSKAKTFKLRKSGHGSTYAPNFRVSQLDKNMKQPKITLYEYFRQLIPFESKITESYLRKFDDDKSFLFEAGELAAIFKDLTGQNMSKSQINYLSRFIFTKVGRKELKTKDFMECLKWAEDYSDFSCKPS